MHGVVVMRPFTTVLCGGPGLGFYVPGVILAKQLERHCPVEVEVIERLLPADKQELVIRSRRKFHADFRIALMAQRLATDITNQLDTAQVEATLQRWRASDRRRFVVFSGFWATLVQRYLRDYAPGPVAVDFCHVDSAPSSSWGLVEKGMPGIRNVWFLRFETRSLHYRLDVNGEPPLPFTERARRLLCHGGGWGMGTYRERTRALAEHELGLDLLCYEHDELDALPGARHFILDPDWFPFRLRRGESLFPPLGSLQPGGAVQYTVNAKFPELYNFTRRAAAIVSKPGAGTLIDSLSAATPLITLEPFGEYERKNGELWREFGFAIDFDDWVRTGCSLEALEPLHRNLLAARQRLQSYAEHCCELDAPDSGAPLRTTLETRP